MKIRQKIEKKQVGGIIYTPFLPSYQDNASQTPTQETETNTGKIGDIQKEILEVLQENGLPSDVNLFLNKATSFLRRAEMTGEWSMSDFARVQAMANMVAHNKGLYDAATQHLTETGNWNEIALNDRGQMYVMDKEGKVSAINPDEYYKNQKKYSPLTNNYILEYRSQATPFDSSVLNSMSGSIGVNDVVDYAKSIILDFGTRSISGYTNSELAKMEESLYGLIAGGPQGYYKFKQEAQIDNSTAQQAINYIYNALPTNMKQLLRAKTAAEGQDPNLHSADLLIQALSNHLDSSTSVDYDSTATANDPKYADVTTSGKTVERTLPERYVDGNGLGEHQMIRITPRESTVHLLAWGQSAQTIMDKDGKTPLPSTTLANVLTDSLGIGGITRKDSISFGDQLLNPTDYDKVMYDSSTPLYRVMLPYKDVGGRIVPDFDKQELAQQLQDEIEAQGITDPGYIAQLVDDYFQGSATYNTQTGTIDFKNTMAFLTFGAIVNTKLVDIDKDSPYLQNLERSEGRDVKSLYENIVKYHSPYEAKDEVNDVGRVGKKKNFYMGNIFIPIDNALAGTLVYNNDIAPASRYQNTTAQLEANKYTRQIQQGEKPRTNF